MDLHKKILTLIITFVVLIFVECEHNEQTASLCNNCQQNNMCNNTESCAVDCKTESKEIDGKCVGKCTENCVQCEEEWCLSCSGGYFGLSCQERCQGTCSDQGCDRKTGRCFSELAMPANRVGKTDAEDLTRTVIMWFAGAAIITAIALVIAVIIIVRCSNDVTIVVTSHNPTALGKTEDLEVHEL